MKEEKSTPLTLERLQYGDMMRSFASIAVVFIHAAAGRTAGAISFSEGPSWLMVNAILILSRWSVPVFFMLSGALLLDPSRQESTVDFYRKRCARIGLPLIFWSLFYIIFDALLNGNHISIRDVVAKIISARPEVHLWFIYAIVMLYLVTPFTRIFLNAVNERERWALAVGLLILSSLSTLFWIYTNSTTWRLPPEPIFTVEWGFYAGYYVLGYLVRDINISKRDCAAAFTIFVITSIISIFIIYILTLYDQSGRAKGIVYGYTSPVVIVQSLMAYFFISGMARCSQFPWRFGSFTANLSMASLGIYLIHIAWLRILEVKLEWCKTMGVSAISVMMLGVVVFIASWFSTYLILRLPIARKVVGAR